MYCLKEPLSLPKLTLRNRLILPPVATYSCDENGYVTEKTIQHYAERAQGGHLGLMILEHCFIAQAGKAKANQMSLADDKAIDGLRKLVDEIHRHGVPVVAQLNHAGGFTQREVTGQEVIAPSVCSFGGKICPDRALTREEIVNLPQLFADAARRAVAAGLDGVEIHSAHGYLLNQFFSPLTNQRTDDYGGSLQNRVRLHLEVIAAVRKAVGESYPIFLRLGARDEAERGSTVADSIEAVKSFEAAGVDVLDISGGLTGYLVPGKETVQGYFSDVTQAIKQSCNLPVILTGGITQPEAAEQLLRDGKADLIGVGRAMNRDARWAEKAFAALQ